MLPQGLRQSLTLTSAPAFDVSDAAKCLVSLASARDQCRADASAGDDAYMTDLIASATARLDGADGILGRALLTQTWEMRLDRFSPLPAPAFIVASNVLAGVAGNATGRIRIPLPPLVSITSVKYVDVDGTTVQTLDPSLYQVVKQGTRAAFIEPAFGKSWPAHALISDAVRIVFVAGYGDGAAIPAPLKHAARILIKHWYDVREPIVSGAAIANVPESVDALIAPYIASWF